MAIEYIPVTEKETVEIIRRLGHVALAFGTGGVALKWDREQPMPPAVELVCRMRGVWFEDGAGI
jgi:hypothetical protein